MSSLDAFLGRATALPGGADSSSDSFLVTGDDVAGRSRQPTAPSESAVVANATTVARDTTPNGTVIEYEAAPRRLYRVNGIEVPSVTTVLDVLAKGGLTIWGWRVGIQGVLDLFDRGHLTTAFDWDADKERVAVSDGHYASLKMVEALLKLEGMTTNDAKGSAADRGNIVHQALENWARTAQIPNPDDFDEREKGYVEGIVKFLEDANPEPVRTEVLVGSAEHGYAGRYDLEIAFKETRKVRLTPKQKWHEIGPGNMLTDCKSSSEVYPSTHFRQLAGYEGARVECGYEPTDGQYVLWVNGEGSYAYVPSNAVLDDFLAVLSVYKSDQHMKEKKAA